MKGFKAFLFRGNLIDLAVAVVIGVAFTAVVHALISDLITPILAAIGGQSDFSALSFTVHHSVFRYGSFLNELISFVLIAAVVYFVIVAPTTKVMAIADRNKAATERDCPECLSSIPVKATRCKFCTATVPPASAPAATDAP